jgi:hypothetical protein
MSILAKTTLASATSAFEALSLGAPRSRVGIILSGDEKATSVQKSLFVSIMGDSSVASLIFGSQSEVAHADESLFSGPLKKPLLDKHLSHFVKCEAILCSTHNQELVPPVKQSKEHKAQTALQLSLNSFKLLKKYMPDEDEYFQKTLYYRAIVNVLFSELSFFQTVVKQLSVMMTLQHMQDFLVSNLDMTWSKSGQRYEVQGTTVALDFSDLESYAFYLRFYKPLKGSRDFEAIYKLLQSQREVFTHYRAAPTAQMLVMMTSLLGDLSEIRAEKCKPLLSELSKKLLLADSTFHDPCMPHLVSVFAPNYGYLLCEKVRQVGKTLASIDKRDVDPFDTKLWDRPKASLLGMLEDGYLDKQIQIYNHAFEKMQQMVAARPIYKTTINFDHYNEGSKIAIYTPEQFKRHVIELQKSIKSSIANCVPISEISLDKVKKEGKENEVKDEKKSEKKESPSGRVSQAPSASRAQKKPKRKKKKAQSDKTPLDSEKVSSSTPLSLTQVVSSPTAFLSRPRRHFPDERVERWYAIDLSNFSKIRDFRDISRGQVLYRYKDLNDEALKLQLLLHGAAPKLDRLLDDLDMRKKYCITTLTGVGIFVEIRSLEAVEKAIKLEAVDKAIKGMLFIAINGKIYFHRKADILPMARIRELSLSKLVDEAAQAVLAALSKEPSKEELAEVEKAISADHEKDEVTVDKYEIIHFIDSRLKCKVSAIPLC